MQAKRPQSLYLRAVAHNRLATYVENALDGAGSLNGFIAFVEEGAARLLDPDEREIRSYGDSPADHALADLTTLGFDRLRQPLGLYLEKWRLFTEALGWSGQNPAGAHIIALLALVPYPSLWAIEPRTRDLQPYTEHFVDLKSVSAALFRLENPRPTDSPTTVAEDENQHRRPVVRRSSLDFVLPDRREPVSIYLDEAAHQLVYRAFGNEFYDKMEQTLLWVLENPTVGYDVSAASAFLEAGVGGITPAGLRAKALDLSRLWAHYARPRSDTQSDYTRVDDETLDEYAREAGFAGLDDPGLIRGFLTKMNVRRAYVESTWGWDFPVRPDDFLDLELQVLRFADQLGLLDGSDVGELPSRMATVVAERYGITEVTPTRDNVFRLLASGSSTDDLMADLSTAVDFHFWSLFQLYVNHCFPHLPADHPRKSRAVLATLAEPSLFERTAALAVFSGANVTKTATGEWQFRKGRKLLLELENADGLAAGRLFSDLVPLRDPVTTEGEWGELMRLATEWPEARNVLSVPRAVDHVLEALECLETHRGEKGGDWVAVREIATRLSAGWAKGNKSERGGK